MDNMFHNATSSNPDVSRWDVSSVKNMTLMFSGATSAFPEMGIGKPVQSYVIRQALGGGLQPSTTEQLTCLTALTLEFDATVSFSFN